jgi:hypothetical protein
MSRSEGHADYTASLLDSNVSLTIELFIMREHIALDELAIFQTDLTSLQAIAR